MANYSDVGSAPNWRQRGSGGFNGKFQLGLQGGLKIRKSFEVGHTAFPQNLGLQFTPPTSHAAGVGGNANRQQECLLEGADAVVVATALRVDNRASALTGHGGGLWEDEGNALAML